MIKYSISGDNDVYRWGKLIGNLSELSQYTHKDILAHGYIQRFVYDGLDGEVQYKVWHTCNSKLTIEQAYAQQGDNPDGN